MIKHQKILHLSSQGGGGPGIGLRLWTYGAHGSLYMAGGHILMFLARVASGPRSGDHGAQDEGSGPQEGCRAPGGGFNGTWKGARNPGRVPMQEVAELLEGGPGAYGGGSGPQEGGPGSQEGGQGPPRMGPFGVSLALIPQMRNLYACHVVKSGIGSEAAKSCETGLKNLNALVKLQLRQSQKLNQ